MTQEINGPAFEANDVECVFSSGRVTDADNSENAHFSEALGRVYLTARAALRSARPAGPTQPALTVLVEDSADGSAWATISTFPFTAGGQQSAAVDSPRRYMRTSWTIDHGTWETDVQVQSLASASGGDGSKTSIPIADPTGIVIDSTTYDNNVSGDGGKLTTLVFPGRTAALALAFAGDAFPRVILTTDGDGCYFGNGTFDPYDAGGGVAGVGSAGEGELFSGLGMGIRSGVPGGDFRPNYNMSTGGFALGEGAVLLVGGTGVPTHGGEVGDIYFRTDGSGPNETLYKCTVAGVGGAATWVGIL